MNSDVPLDCAVFQLSPRRSHCELFVSYDGKTEKLASGLVKPFVTHLKVAEEQVALSVKSIKLETEQYKNAETWFTKGTLERFVRFVSTPEVVEMVNTFDAEMSQLEAARRIYSQGAGDSQSSASGGDGAGAIAASDSTKKELLRAIDVRLSAVKQDLTSACTHASAAGFNPESVLELQRFADCFGALRLSEACSKFIELSQRRPDLLNNNNNLTWTSSTDRALRSSTSSDMSLDSPSGDQPPKSSTSKVTIPLRRFSRGPSTLNEPEETENKKDRDSENDKDKALGPTTSTTTAPTMTESEPMTQSSQTPKLSRRLSVQERISLFENKQKESSPSTTTPSSASAGLKPDPRRLSSEVASSSDKTVLRRWSGASDMSIDVSGERKEPDSNANTPGPSSSSSNSQVFPTKPKDQVDLKVEEGDKEKDLKESKVTVRAKFCSQSAVLPGGGSGSASESGSGLEEPILSGSNSKIPSFCGRSSENLGLKEPSGGGVVRSRGASFGRGEDFGFENQTSVEAQIKFQPEKSGQFNSADLLSPQEKGKDPSSGRRRLQLDTGKDIEGPDGHQGDAEDNVVRDQSIARSQLRYAQRRTLNVAAESAASEIPSQTVIQKKGGEVGSLPEPRWRSLEGEVEKVGSESFEGRAEGFSVKFKNSGSSRSKFQGQSPVSEQVKKPRGVREESGFGFDSGQPGFAVKNALENQEAFSSNSVESMDEVQRMRQSKGNQGLNDELKMKAKELEKLFAEHKLRAPADQSNSARRTKPAEAPKEQSINRKSVMEASLQLKSEAETPAGSSNMRFNSTPLMKTVDSQDYDVTPKHDIYSLSFSDDSRGKLYQKYMQRRDAKLKEDWSSRRDEKEAKMKAMQDSLEKSRTELMSKLAGSADKRNYARDASQLAEKLRSFNVRSAVKKEQLIESFVSDEDEDQTEFISKKLSETFLGDSSSRSAQSKRVPPSKNASSSTPRNSAVPIPRSSAKASNSAAGRRRLNSDNPLAQSVPNFSDLRKENTKPSSVGSKPARSQGRNHARKKGSSEDLQLISEDKPRKFQSLRKSTANPVELNDSLNSDDMVDTDFVLSKYEKEENDDHNKFSKHMESKPFTKKGNSVGRTAGFGIGKSHVSVIIDSVRNGLDLDDVSFDAEEMTDVTKEDDDDFDTTVGGESADMDNGKERQSQGSDKSANSGYENSDSFKFAQVGPAAATELPTSLSMPSLFRTMGSLQDSPGESPGSWNSHVQNLFPFPHEASDIDASDSPLGSPASWNFHSLAQTEADAARMRKKWGAAQKPIVGTDASHNRKDVTKGLKRFLKFGRKNRASESLADWVSVTTSEGDDDTEDGRDPAYRSSEDLRKSRMGFSHSNHSDDGFNESDLFNEQAHALQSSIPAPSANFKLREEHLSGSSLKAPKSFFSLSNFRSKGSDSKLR